MEEKRELAKDLAARGKSHWKKIGCMAWKKTITNCTSWKVTRIIIDPGQDGFDLQGGEIFLPPEVRLHPRAERGTEVVEVHQSVDSWPQPGENLFVFVT